MRYNGNKFSVYESEEKTVLGLLGELGSQVNHNTEDLEKVKESDNKKVSHDEMNTIYKIDKNADFTGSWHGIKKPTASQEGLQATVDKIVEEDIPSINEQLDNIDDKVNNFTYDNKEIPLVGQGVPTDVNVLMKKDFNNNKREYALGVEINANGSRGDHNIETAGGHKVAIYGSAHTGVEGKPYIWSFNTLAQADEGLEENAMVQGYELDVNNNQGDRYQQYNWDNGIVLGLNVTSGGSYPITCGIRIGGTGSHNLPYQGILIDGAKENAIMLLNNYYRGIQFAYANIETNEVLSLNKDQMISVTDTTNNSSSPLIRFLNKYTVLHSQGGGLMITTKDGSKMLFEVREDGTVNVPEKLESARLECPVISTGQGEIRPTLSGDSGAYPPNPLIGQCYFDRTRGIPLWFNGVGWVNAQGNLPS